MLEVELHLDLVTPTQSPPSWLLCPIEIASSTEIFSGVITTESFEWLDPQTLRAVFTIEAHAPIPLSKQATVINVKNNTREDLKRLSPSAGTSWPISESAECLINQTIILGTLYNQNQTDPVSAENHGQHIFRPRSNQHFILDDTHAWMCFTHKQNQLKLSNSIYLDCASGDIQLSAMHTHRFNANGNMTELCKKNYTQLAKNNFSITTEQGNIAYHSEKNIQLNHHAGVFLQAPTILFQTTDANLTGNISLFSEEKLVFKNNSSCDIDAMQTLEIMAENKILISGQGMEIEITPKAINFTGAQITITGQPILTVRSTDPG